MGQFVLAAASVGLAAAGLVGATVGPGAAFAYRPVLPNASMTPGAFNPAVRQATIGKTICVRGWTKTVRPPVAYTDALKLAQMRLYGESGLPSAYEMS